MLLRVGAFSPSGYPFAGHQLIINVRAPHGDHTEVPTHATLGQMAFRVVVMNDGKDGYMAEAPPVTPLREGSFSIVVYDRRIAADQLHSLVELGSLRDPEVLADGAGLQRMKDKLETAGEFTILGTLKAPELETNGFTTR